MHVPLPDAVDASNLRTELHAENSLCPQTEWRARFDNVDISPRATINPLDPTQGQQGAPQYKERCPRG
jgi:hypothetical protein